MSECRLQNEVLEGFASVTLNNASDYRANGWTDEG